MSESKTVACRDRATSWEVITRPFGLETSSTGGKPRWRRKASSGVPLSVAALVGERPCRLPVPTHLPLLCHAPGDDLVRRAFCDGKRDRLVAPAPASRPVPVPQAPTSPAPGHTTPCLRRMHRLRPRRDHGPPGARARHTAACQPSSATLAFGNTWRRGRHSPASPQCCTVAGVSVRVLATTSACQPQPGIGRTNSPVMLDAGQSPFGDHARTPLGDQLGPPSSPRARTLPRPHQPSTSLRGLPCCWSRPGIKGTRRFWPRVGWTSTLIGG